MPSIRTRNCAKPPANWGPGVHHLIFPLVIDVLPASADVSYYGYLYIPFDAQIYGWWYGTNTFSGGSTPAVKFTFDWAVADCNPSNFSTDTAEYAPATQNGDYVDATGACVIRTRASATAAWMAARCQVTGQPTTLAGLYCGVSLMQLEGGIAAIT